MTEQKVIELLNNYVIDTRFGLKAMADTRELLDICEKAVKKQIPMKPKYMDFAFDKSTVAYCPCCEFAFGEIKPIECIHIHTAKMLFRNKRKEYHCEVCGQSIDWEEVQEGALDEEEKPKTVIDYYP